MRRLAAFRAAFHVRDLTEEQQSELEDARTDEPSDKLRERYQSIDSVWNFQDKEHVSRMARLMHQWIVDKHLPKAEIESRLRVFHFLNNPAMDDILPMGHGGNSATSASYKEAVGDTPMLNPSDSVMNPDIRSLYDLCVRPAPTRTQQRDITEQDERAIQLILTQELEVTYPPRFLAQVMTAIELARFTDFFHTLEYPLYAHLEPGQRLSDNFSHQVLLSFICVGQAASAEHRMTVTEFTTRLLRVQLDIKRRFLIIYFNGKRSAKKWINWAMPFNGRTQPLIDYESIRERAKITREIVRIVRLDSYRFAARTHKGMRTSTNMHEILSRDFGLTVLALEHPSHAGSVFDDRQWTVTLAAEGVRRKSSISPSF